jgi:hypothetical protein
MTTATEHSNDAPSSVDQQQFVYLVNNVFVLLEAAKRELERDGEAARAAHGVVDSAIRNRTSFARQRSRPRRTSSLADSAPAFFHRRKSAPDHPRQGPQHRSEAKHSAFHPIIQASLRRTTARLRNEETAGASMSSYDCQYGIIERDSPKRRLFPSNASFQTLQAGIWSKPIRLKKQPSESARADMRNLGANHQGSVRIASIRIRDQALKQQKPSAVRSSVQELPE